MGIIPHLLHDAGTGHDIPASHYATTSLPFSYAVTVLTRLIARFPLTGRLVLALCCCGAGPALGAQAEDAAQTVPDYQDIATIYGDLQAAENVPVTMRDGVAITVDIYRPDDDDRHPALYAAGPYPHTGDLLADRQTQVGPVAWYVSQGYAVVVADVRGTGNAGGDFSFFARQEQQDHYEIVEWIAQQDWSDGQVAGTGAGYYAASQWQMAIQNPPHLSCIAPINGTTDPFRDWISPGGLGNDAFINAWYDRDIRLANAYTPGVERLVNYDLRLAQLAHPVYDDYWRIRNSLDSVRLVNVPVFAVHDWSLAAVESGITSTVNALAGLNSSNKLLIANADGDTPIYQDTDFLGRELLPYYDWCFNGKSASAPYIALPRIRYTVRGQQSIKRESAWPPGNTSQQSWFLNNAADATGPGLLDASRQSGTPGFSAFERRDSDAEVVFISAPLERDMEIAGPLMLELYASSTATDLAVEVTLREEVVYQTLTPSSPLARFRRPAGEQAPQPAQASTLITVSRGSLKASARQRETNLGGEYSPVYALATNRPLVPGQVTRLDIALRQTAYHFSAGNRLVLEIRPVNDGSLVDGGGRDMFHHNAQYPSRLWLPVVRTPVTATQRQAPPPPSIRQEDGGDAANMVVPDLRILTPETVDALDGDEDSPIIFVPR